jgi:3-oxoacyl-(acyl-carrier-protein) synthase
VVRDLPVKIGGAVPSLEEDPDAGFDPDAVPTPKDQRKVDRFILFALGDRTPGLARSAQSWLRHQGAPPTLNLSAPDPGGGGIDFVGNQARPLEINYSISDGFASEEATPARYSNAGRTSWPTRPPEWPVIEASTLTVPVTARL